MVRPKACVYGEKVYQICETEAGESLRPQNGDTVLRGITGE